MDLNELLKELNKLYKKINVNFPISVVCIFLFMLSGYYIIFKGFKETYSIIACGIIAAEIVWMIKRVKKVKKILKKSRVLAADKLIFTEMSKYFQINKFCAEREIPKETVADSGIADIRAGYDGYGYMEATYRGFYFSCGNFTIYQKARDGSSNERWKATHRYEESRFYRYAMTDGMFAVIKTGFNINGYIKIERNYKGYKVTKTVLH